MSQSPSPLEEVMYEYACCVNFKPGARKIGLEQGKPIQRLG